jgi:hypothetical protein
MVDHLPNKHEVLHSNPIPTEKQSKRRKERRKEGKKRQREKETKKDLKGESWV